MTSLLNNFKQHLDYYDPDTSIGQDEITVSGGHGGIGSISNVFGSVKVEKETDEEGNQIEVSKILLNNEEQKAFNIHFEHSVGDRVIAGETLLATLAEDLWKDWI